MKYCNICGLPETYETIEFDINGICNICHQQDYKKNKIDWTGRKKIFDQLIDSYRGINDYDCIVPFSGGKDSTYTLYYLVKEYKLKPLVVQFNHGFMRPNLLENNKRTFSRLGVDVISFTPNWKLVKKLMRESLIRKGDFCWHCHTGIFSYPMHIALKFNIPLVIWGEPSSEYTAYYDYTDDKIEEVDETRFNRFINLGITAQDMYGMVNSKDEFDKRDFIPYTYPPLSDLKKLRYRSVCLGSFISWDVKKQSKIITEDLGWKGDEVEGMPPNVYEYEKIECAMQGVRDYLKFLKRGYSRVTQMTAIDIRNGRLSKSEADKLIREWEGKKPHSLKIFLDYLEMTEDEFNDIAEKLVIPPNEPNVSIIKWGKPTWDFEQWFRETKE